MDLAFALVYTFLAGLALGTLLTIIAFASGVFRREPRLRAVPRRGAGVVLAFDPSQPRRRSSSRAGRPLPAPAERQR